MLTLLAGALFALAPAERAEQLVADGQKALAVGDAAAAEARFREALDQGATTPAADAARYGRALALFRLPNPDYKLAADLLRAPAADGNSPDRGGILEALAHCHRQLGLLGGADDKANATHFREAARRFREAQDWYWHQKQYDACALNRCRAAEMDLRLGKWGDARRYAEETAKSEELKGTPSRLFALYLAGFAAFQERDYSTAGALLQQLAPFADPEFGPHARYLAGRVLHAAGETADALTHYEDALADPRRAPDAAAGAAFHVAALAAEKGRTAEALAGFRALAAATPPSAFAPDAAVRASLLLGQLGRFDEAVAPLKSDPGGPRLADQVAWALGRAHHGRALAAPAGPERDAQLKEAVAALQRAADTAQALAGHEQDKDAKKRRKEILFDLADARLAAGQPREAAALYEPLWNDQALPGRREELLARLAVAQGAAGLTDQSLGRCEEFGRTFPQGALTPSVLYRAAENHCGRALASHKQKQSAEQQRQQWDDAAGRFRELIERFPDSPLYGRARLGAAVCAVRLGRWEEAIPLLEAIPPESRGGDLAPASLLLAEALARRPDDAAAARHFGAFVVAAPASPDAPAALLKMARSLRRSGSAGPAAAALDRLAADYPQSAPAGFVPLERAASEGELRAIFGDANRKGPVVIAAAVALAARLREQKQFAEATTVLKDAQGRIDSALAGDPDRDGWRAILTYHAARTLADEGKPAEAKALFDSLTSGGSSKPLAAEAALRSGLGRVAELHAERRAAEQERDAPELDKERRRKAREKLDRLRDQTHQAGDQLLQHAEKFRRAPDPEPRARMLYEAAWVWRDLAEWERARMRDEAAERDPGVPADRLRIGAAPSDDRAAWAYKRLLDDFADAAASAEARFELGELAEARGDAAGALALYRDAAERPAPDRPVDADLLARARRRLGELLASRGEFAAAATAFGAGATAGLPRAAEARCRASECLLLADSADAAAELLHGFGDDLGGRGRLRLGQALLAGQKWDAARAAFEAVPAGPYTDAARLGVAQCAAGSGRHAEALAECERLAAGSDEAAARALMLVGGVRLAQERPAEAAAAFLQVPTGFAAGPELGFAARLEAARAFAADAKPAEARRLLAKLAREAPADGEWAKATAERAER